MRNFIALLEKEQQALLNQDAEQLLPIAETKTAFANKLSKIGNARHQHLSSIDPDLEAAAWILKHAPSARPAWDELRKLAAQAHHINQTNGEVIQLKLRSNQQALGALLGAAKSTASLYGKDGQRSIAVSGRTLGSG